MTPVNENADPSQCRPPSEEIPRQTIPRLRFLAGNFCVAIARQIHESKDTAKISAATTRILSKLDVMMSNFDELGQLVKPLLLLTTADAVAHGLLSSSENDDGGTRS